VPLNCDPSSQCRQQRRDDVSQRSAACHRLGLRTIFHFGAPYNNHMHYGDGPPNCISDEMVLRRYVLLLEIFARDFPDVDDILVYSYDQDAWLCSEFGPCPRAAWASPCTSACRASWKAWPRPGSAAARGAACGGSPGSFPPGRSMPASRACGRSCLAWPCMPTSPR
jgi:hypothetical protein